MRFLTLVLFAITSTYAHELIYISNNTSDENLKELYQKYSQSLVLNDSKVYLVPSECRLERHFGGTSEGTLKLSKVPQQTQDIVTTQEVFEAKDETVITKKVELEKSIALIEGKVSKAFLDDKEGRGFGGASEVTLDFTFQKEEAKKVYMKPQQEPALIVKQNRPAQHPSCRLLNTGAGYVLEHIKDAQLYSDSGIHPIINSTIHFK